KLEARPVQVTAVSSEIPRAITVAYDYRRLEVEAEPFEGEPPPVEEKPDPGDAGAEVVVEDCPGVEDAAGRCSMPSSGTIAVTLHNAGRSSLAVYDRPAPPIDPTQCNVALVTLIPVG